MAMLLAMFQKMKLTREINQLTMKQMLTSSKLSRIEKNISRVQKRYESLFTRLKQDADRLKRNAQQQLMYSAGLSGNNYFNTNNIYGNTGFVSAAAVQILNKYNNNTENKDKVSGLSEEELMTFMANGYKLKTDGTEMSADEKKRAGCYSSFVQQANYAQQQQQQAVQQSMAFYENAISIWMDDQENILEEEQAKALDPLEYEQTNMELDKTFIEQQLERKRAEKESYEQLCSQEAKDSAPKFGLG